MPTVINIPRFGAQNFDITIERFLPNFCAENSAWVSICEPDDLNSVVQNEILDDLPKLSISFWDLTQVIQHGGQTLYPPSPSVAKAIVDFLLSHQEKDIIVNCAAGISRSGAVAQFCEKGLGYEWLEVGKRKALPNPVLFELMMDYYSPMKFDGKGILTAYEKALLRVSC